MAQIKNITRLSDAFIDQFFRPFFQYVHWCGQQIRIQIALNRESSARSASAFGQAYTPVQSDHIGLQPGQAGSSSPELTPGK